MGFLNGIVSGVGSLFGVGGYKPQKQQASPFRNYQQDALKAVSPLAGTYAQMAGRAGGQVNAYGPQYDNAVQGQIDYLNTNPATDANRTARIAQAQGTVNKYTSAAASNLALNYARRGIGGGAAAGGLAANTGRQIAALAGAEQNVDNQINDEAQARPGRLVSFIGDVNADAEARQNAALRNQAGVYGTLYDGYGNLAAGDENRDAAYQQALQRKQEADDAQFGELASLAAQYYTGGLGRRK